MGDIAVSVDDLWKQYKKGRPKSNTLAESITSWFSRNAKDDYFWVLREISLEVKQGEAVGIVGKNGAGKSTLLKILSNITYPTKGCVDLYGRVASLLEVGTGFHPELTGRENVFLNGTILGMSRSEVRDKFDEIVAFSGVEGFIDTPIKHYSSGMKVRLAFSVAAHLEPEILIIDEVLAVGDAEFQKKCLGKMEEVAGQGRTVVFVSHNMGAVENLCSRAYYLSDGKIAFSGGSQEVINRYLMQNSAIEKLSMSNDSLIFSSPELTIDDLKITQGGQTKQAFSSKMELHISVDYTIHYPQTLSFGFQVYTSLDIPVFSTVNWKSCSFGDDMAETVLKTGRYVSKCTIPKDFLNEEYYKVTVVMIVRGNHVIGTLKDALSFAIANDGNMRSHFHSKWIGVVRPRLKWLTEHKV